MWSSEDERHVIHHADSADKLRDIPDDSIDAVVTSPPYDNLREYGGHAWDFKAIANELCRTVKIGGVIVWIVADATRDGSETGTSFRQALYFMDECGMKLHDTMIYKTNKPPANVTNRYQPCFEFAFVFSKGKPAKFNPIKDRCIWGGVGTSPRQRTVDGELTGNSERRIIEWNKVRDNIWHYETGNGKQEFTEHPASFPIPLALDHIESWTDPGDLIIDPFLGSGTTTIAAYRKSRRSIGIEIEQSYYEMSVARINREMAQRKLDFEQTEKQ